jgi:hypothetical protein
LSQPDERNLPTQPVPLKARRRDLKQVEVKRGERLGSCLACYRGRSINRRDVFQLFLPGLLAIIFPLFYGLWTFKTTDTLYGPVAARTWSFPWILLAAIGLITLLILVFLRLSNSRYFINVFEHGIKVHVRPFTVITLRWSQIAGIASGTLQERILGIPFHTYFSATLYPNLGKPIYLGNMIADTSALVNQLKSKLDPLLLPDLQRNFLSDQWIHFGELSLNRQGIRLVKKKILWDQITFLGIKHGYFIIEASHGPKLRQPIFKIPNLEILLRIISWRTNP